MTIIQNKEYQEVFFLRLKNCNDNIDNNLNHSIFFAKILIIVITKYLKFLCTFSDCHRFNEEY